MRCLGVKDEPFLLLSCPQGKAPDSVKLQILKGLPWVRDSASDKLSGEGDLTGLKGSLAIARLMGHSYP